MSLANSSILFCPLMMIIIIIILTILVIKNSLEQDYLLRGRQQKKTKGPGTNNMAYRKI